MSMYAVVAHDSREATLHASLVLEIKGFLCLLNKQIAVTDRSCIVIPPVRLSDCKIVSTNNTTIHIPADAFKFTLYIIIIIMYIYHALKDALSAHMIHINLNMIFYTHVEHSPTKTIYIKYYTKQKTLQTHTHNDCSRNWVLILVRMEIL